MFANNNRKQALIDIRFDEYEDLVRRVIYIFEIIRNRQNSLLLMKNFLIKMENKFLKKSI